MSTLATAALSAIMARYVCIYNTSTSVLATSIVTQCDEYVIRNANVHVHVDVQISSRTETAV